MSNILDIDLSADPLGGVDLTAIKAKPKSKAKVYPILPDPDGSLAKLAGTIRELDAEADQIKGSLEVHKTELKEVATDFYFKHYAGRSDVESTVQAVAEDGKPVNISLSARCKGKPALAIPLMGDLAARFLRKAFSISVDGDKIPAEHAATLVNRMVDLFGEFGCGDALTASQKVVPTPAFFTERHTAFTPDVNLQIDEVMPVIAAVKAKVRR